MILDCEVERGLWCVLFFGPRLFGGFGNGCMDLGVFGFLIPISRLCCVLIGYLNMYLDSLGFLVSVLLLLF